MRLTDFWSQLKEKLSISTSKQRSLTRNGLIAVAVIVLLAFVAIMVAEPRGQKLAVVDRHKLYFTVKPGMNTSEIGDALLERGIIDSKLGFWWQIKINGYDDKVKAGTYQMYAGMTAKDAAEQLVYGKTVVVRLTIPEGFSVRDIAKRLDDDGLVNKERFLELAKAFAPFDYIDVGGRKDILYAAEGFLFPDTYEIDGAVGSSDILKMMANNFNNRLTADMRERAAAEKLSIYELVTLASLVEKESLHDKDRPIIAQIFRKRLSIGMPLQADPTIQYLLDAPKEDLTFKDTEINSPYNTYQNMGLPPGPIANPGLASLMAVLYPADTDYLYFVADREGNNYYSHSYDEHLAIVDRVR